MLQSKLFTKTRREAPTDETAKNAQLLIRAGYINKEMAGVYSLLPLGLRVVNKIRKIVSEEMEKIGSEEIIMSTLQNKKTWEKTDRWDDKKVDIWFKSKLKNDNEVGLGWSHEEPITEMAKSFISSYKDLEHPVVVHQFQNKLRNEVRAKSGIIRCREFLMKDMYAFCATEEDNVKFYNQAMDAYKNVFRRAGIGNITFITAAEGGVFTDKFSHEFQTLCDAGEDVIYINQEDLRKGLEMEEGHAAVNKEFWTSNKKKDFGIGKDFVEEKAAEVGNIFNFGTSKCEQMGLYYNDKDGNKKPVHLSSYGIGITRLMGVLVEVFGDDKGLVWPESVAPFKVHLIGLGQSGEEKKEAEKVYQSLLKSNIEVLFDDRDESAGVKFADSDLLGIPYRAVISKKTMEQGKIEWKKRSELKAKMADMQEVIAQVT